MINIDNAIRFPFAQKNWQNTVGVYFVILFIISVITAIISVFFKLPADILDEIARNQSNEALNTIASGAYLVSGLISMVVGLITLPVSLYLTGYIFNTTRNVMYDVKEPIRPHGEIMTRLKFGAAKFIIKFILGIVAIIGLFIPSIVAIAAAMSYGSALPLSIVLWIFAGLLFIAWLVFTFFGLTFTQYSMEYLYLKDGIKSIFQFEKIKELIKQYWKEYLLLLGLEVVAGVAVAMTIITCCLQFIAQPVLQAIAAFVLTYSFGVVYRQIYNSEKTSEK